MSPRNSRLAVAAGTAAALVLATAATAVPAAPGSSRAAAARPALAAPPPSLVGFTPELPQSVVAASSAAGSRWKPERAVYGTASRDDIPVKGAGGTAIRVNEIYPTLANGKPAPGKFPVVMTITPYGKGQGGSSQPGSAQQPAAGTPTGGANNYLVQRGYIDVVVDVRGTGDSNGQWGLFDPIQQRDSIAVLNWAAHLPNSTGKVGTYGPSYLGIDQMLLAGAVGPHSPLKAIFPVVPGNDLYRDTATMGGLIDAEFSGTYLGLTGSLNVANPLQDAASDPQLLASLAGIEADHANGLANYHAATLAQILTGGVEAYDESYWQARSPQNVIRRIVANHIPAYLVGGEFDIFQRGEPIDYAELQNAWAGRSDTVPMRAGQRVTGRYQLIDGPWEHLNGSSVDLDLLELEWFDTWLKGEHTGMAETPTPLHYYDLGTGAFDETTTYPFVGAKPTRFYLGSGGALATTRPGTAGTDTLAWSPVGSPCGRPVDQWEMGGDSIPAHTLGLPAPCADDDRAWQTPGDTVSYTTAPFRAPSTLAGPIAATVYASAMTSETEWVAEIEEVAPDGTSYPLTSGALLGSLRAVDRHRSWTAHGMPVLPYHPYTRASQRPVPSGKVVEYQIEIYPTLATIARGDRLRLTLSTADTPHLTPLPEQLPQLAGGIYTIEHAPTAPSSLTFEFRRP
ncbi:MAG TPA: CocE/NonD family hydrolase [Mycobacteriales bacterium]|jgi:putative CocE/NonD family hydrolase|nr:CocE/NonD family hydrolase [Mycobacteriales bacterium]